MICELPVLGAGGTAPSVWLLDDPDPAALRARARGLVRDASATRSYRSPYALVARHDHAVGVDIERLGSLPAGFADVICTPDERERAEDDAALLTALWSSKEALTKALGDALDYDPARLDAPLFWPHGRCGPWRCAPLAVPAGHVGWVCWNAGVP